MRQFAKGGVITGPPITEYVKVKLSEGRHYYWEPELGRWAPILTPAEVRDLGRPALEISRQDKK